VTRFSRKKTAEKEKMVRFFEEIKRRQNQTADGRRRSKSKGKKKKKKKLEVNIPPAVALFCFFLAKKNLIINKKKQWKKSLKELIYFQTKI